MKNFFNNKSLELLCSGSLNYISNHTQSKENLQVVKYSKNSEAYLLSTCFGLLSISLISNFEDNTIDTSKYSNYILSCQKEDGTFMDPCFDNKDLISNHDISYLTLQFTYFSLLALSSVKLKPKTHLAFLEPYHDVEYIINWLEKMDWSKPWLESNNVMFIACLLAQDKNCKNLEELMDSFFNFLDKKQNPRTGLWGTDETNILEGVAGAFHYLIPYYYHKRSIQHIEKIIDSTLSLLSFDHLFVKKGGGGACEDLDAIDILCKLYKMIDYRHDSIKKILENALRSLKCCQNRDGGFSYRLNPFSCRKYTSTLTDPFSLRVHLLNALNVARERWHYLSTWYFSGWKLMPYPLIQSDMWSTYARLVSIASISNALGLPGKWNFLEVPGIGWD